MKDQIKIDKKVVEEIYTFDAQGEETENVSCRVYEISIMLDRKIGYAELFCGYDDDGDETYAYVKSIHIDSNFRNFGYGTATLKILAQEHGSILLCPDNPDAERLYARLGEKEERIPEALEAEIDNFGIMYSIEG